MPRLNPPPEFESDDDSARNPAQGGVSVGDSLAVGGDVTGRDKFTAGGNIVIAGPGANVILSGGGSEPSVAEDEPPAPGVSPFKGLQYFDEADAGMFFGRERLIAKLAGQLREHRFLAVIVGASGSGKSSLVRAGLIPALRWGEPLADGALPPEGSTRWPVHVITPTAHPLKALAASLTHDSESVTVTATLMDDLARDPRSLDLAVSRRLTQSEGGGRLLLVVDQFEELFTACQDEAERRHFVENLMMATSLTTDGPTTVVITLRADFYAFCAQYESLREAVAKRQEYIGPMTAGELRRAIEEPARLGNWELEPGLVEALLKDVGADGEGQPEPGALPLLSHALLETWNRRRGRKLTLRGYAESGGVREAIARTAERVYAQLTPAGQTIARNIFVRLTELGEGTQDTRRRVALDELFQKPEDAPAVQAVLKLLTDARLVTTEANTAEVAHEALIREWPALRRWLNEDREGLRMHRQLTKDAQTWAALNRDEGALYRGARLAQTGEWAEKNDDQLSALEREFLNASRTLQVSELETAKKRAAALRQRALYLAGALVLALVAFITAGLFSVQATQSANTARTAEAQAVEQKLTAVAAQAVADQQRDEAERQAQIAFAGKLAAQAQAVYEENPLLGICLALESLAFAPPDDEVARGSTADLLRKLIASGRVSKLGDDVAAIYPNPDNTLLVIDYATKPGELRRTADGSLVQTLSGEVADVDVYDTSSVYFSPDPQTSYFVVSYDGKPSELRRTADGGLVQTLSSSDVFSVYFSPDPQASYVVVYYSGGKPRELRRTADGNLVQTLSGVVHSVFFSPGPQASYFVVSYRDGKPAELRRTADISLVQTLSSGFVNFVSFSPDPQASYFVMSNPGKPSELRRTADGSLVQSLSRQGNIANFGVHFSPDPQASYFFVRYGDGMSGELRRTADGSIVPLPGAVDSVSFSRDPQASYFLVDYFDQPGELRRTADLNLMQTLSGDVLWVKFSRDLQASYFVVSYADAIHGELRRTADGSMVQTPEGYELGPIFGDTFSETPGSWDASFSPDPRASYLVTSYRGTPFELRRTADGSWVQGEGGATANFAFFSPDPLASYFVVTYIEGFPAELRRTGDGSWVQTLSSGDVFFVSFSPDLQASYFVVGYNDGTSELWTTEDDARRLSQLGLGLKVSTDGVGVDSASLFFEMNSQRLITYYSDSRAYILDLALLSALGGDPAALSPEELTRIACEQLFAPGKFSEAQLAPYLDGQEARACK
ncbi:MAG TPA: hypothetical protein VJ020_11410 [Anaerolineales bacterium]|nr:hypothetical protein [Anaerolineales bacterium]